MRYVGIDPSSKTGLVVLESRDGGPLHDYVREITSDAQGAARIDYIVKALEAHLKPDDIVCIEGFSHGSKGAAVDMQYGIGWAIRLVLHRLGVKVIEAAPSQVKKFATGSHMAKKENMILPIYKHWHFEDDSDNIRDAFVLAQIALRLHVKLDNTTKYQQEVLDALQGIKKTKSRKRATG